MHNKSQQLAFLLLKEAKEQGTLDPSIQAGLAELISSESRPSIKEVLNPSDAVQKAKEEKPRELSPEHQAWLRDAYNHRGGC